MKSYPAMRVESTRSKETLQVLFWEGMPSGIVPDKKLYLHVNDFFIDTNKIASNIFGQWSGPKLLY